jgi:hypothetical protein
VEAGPALAVDAVEAAGGQVLRRSRNKVTSLKITPVRAEDAGRDGAAQAD